MSDTSVAADFHQSLDIQRNFSSQVTFYKVFFIDDLSDFTRTAGKIKFIVIRTPVCITPGR